MTTPGELVYRILDNLDQETIFWSVRNVCARLNAITDTYYRYQVKLTFIIKSDLLYFVKHDLRGVLKYIG